MLIFLERDLATVFLPYFVNNFFFKFCSSNIVLTGHISWSGCLYFLRYSAICALNLTFFREVNYIVKYGHVIRNITLIINDFVDTSHFTIF